MFQCCLERSYIHLHLQKFMIFFLFSDLLAEKICTYLRTSTQSFLIQTHQHNSLNHSASSIGNVPQALYLQQSSQGNFREKE